MGFERDTPVSGSVLTRLSLKLVGENVKTLTE